MKSVSVDLKEAATTGSLPAKLELKQTGVIALFFLTAWCGLVAGLLEVGTIVVRKWSFDPNQLYRMSRHFVWLIPVTNICVFLAIGLLLYTLGLVWPRRGRRLAAHLLCALTLMPALLVAFPRLYGLAWMILALGVAARLVPFVLRRARDFRRLIRISFPVLVGVLLLMGGTQWFGDRIKQTRENNRPLPSPGSPNVLLIVLDTVAAGHLSLHGYRHDTSTTLVELAERGIRFDRAQAPSSWTLPSHATMFTGRWLHELSVGWLNPLDDKTPTLAEYLGARGYATAGFIANTGYCASDSGLGRGFTQYHDFIFPKLTAFKVAVLVSRALEGIKTIAQFLDEQQEFVQLRRYVANAARTIEVDRKTAAVVNREFLQWLSRRTQSERPFFTFLNYADAHAPYQLAEGRLRRFGSPPTDDRQVGLIEHWADLDIQLLSPHQIAFATSAYDDCIADLDEQMGKLLDDLKRRGVLDRTWLIVTADHGESFGEHTGVFLHGSSLYQTELHVPLVIVPPGGRATGQAINETVSLRDLPATIVDVLDLESGSPLPGDSLARFWQEKPQTAAHSHSSSATALSEVVPADPLERDPYGLPKKTWPMGALLQEEWSYIRREGDVREELFRLREDAKQQHNLVGDPAAGATLEQMRKTLGRLTAGPLLPQRFSR